MVGGERLVRLVFVLGLEELVEFFLVVWVRLVAGLEMGVSVGVGCFCVGGIERVKLVVDGFVLGGGGVGLGFG